MRFKIFGVLFALVVGSFVYAGSAAAAAPTAGSDHCVATNEYAWFGNDVSYNTYLPSRIDGTFGCALSNGDKDGRNWDPVATLQWNLNKCNSAKLTVDGAYGSKTEAAVKAVQKAHKIAQDGVWGWDTMRRMKWWISEDTSSGGTIDFCGYVNL